MPKRKSPRFIEAEDKGRDSNANQNLSDEIKALKKDNLVQAKKLNEQEATVKSQESRLKIQEARIISQDNVLRKKDANIRIQESEIQRQKAEAKNREASLAEEVTCMVCLDLPGPGKVPVCVNGHIICQICIRKLIRDQKSCPSCKGSLTPERFSLLANNICDMIRYPCPNKDLGCTQFPGRQGRERHISNVCKYEKNIPCPRRTCTVKVSLADHRDHFIECDLAKRYLKNNKIELKQEKFIKGRNSGYLHHLLSEIEDDSFFLIVRQSGYEIVIKNVNRYKQYSVSCKIYSDEHSRSFEGKTVPLGTPKYSDLYKKNCLKVPDFLIEQLEGQENQKFRVDLKIDY